MQYTRTTKSLKLRGRLDKDSEGMVILSGDDDLIFRLTHTQSWPYKTYEIEVHGRPTNSESPSFKIGKIHSWMTRL